MSASSRSLTIAVPKGRILEECAPLMERAGIIPEAEFFKDSSRKLQFATNHSNLSLIRVRSFDVATFVSRGAAQLGIAGSDVLMEFDYPDVYAPLDLGIGHCRLSLAEPVDAEPEDLAQASHVRIATKYPHVAAQYFARAGIQAECIKLNGAMELAPKLGLARRIVDLVSTGRTLKENGLHEVAVIARVSSRLIINRTAFKTIPEVATLLERFRGAVHGS